MPVMNDKVKKVVFYSTRNIYSYFSDEKDLIQSNSMINYFSNLPNDDFAIWLSDLAFLSDYLQKIKEIGQNLENDGVQNIEDKLNKVYAIYDYSTADPHYVKVNTLPTLLNSQKNNSPSDSFWVAAYNEYLLLNKNKYFFKPCHFDQYRHWILSGRKTHLNFVKRDNSPEGLNSRASLIHRLGIYHKENEEHAVAAIWPWNDEKENNHDEKWKETIINAIKELYPKINDIVLVIHDGDFLGLKDDEKDKVLFVGRTLSEMNDPNAGDNCALDEQNLRISLIVFQHTNGNVLNPLNKDCYNNVNPPERIWAAVFRYMMQQKIFKDSDANNIISEMHNLTDS